MIEDLKLVIKGMVKGIVPAPKLHILYRHVGGPLNNQADRPAWFSHEKCFKNFIDSLSGELQEVDLYLHILFDGNDESLNGNFLGQWLEDCKNTDNQKITPLKMSFVKFNGGSMVASTHFAYDYAVNNDQINDKDYIYILENDYLHEPNWINVLNELIESGIHFDYLSLYDHPDKYSNSKSFHSMHRGIQSEIFVTRKRHWRTAPSTCGSFIAKRKTLKEDFESLKSGQMDHLLFSHLVGKKKRILLTPMPSLSTHCMVNYLAPTVDWASY